MHITNSLNQLLKKFTDNNIDLNDTLCMYNIENFENNENINVFL